jgi:hypothetical protein
VRNIFIDLGDAFERIKMREIFFRIERKSGRSSKESGVGEEIREKRSVLTFIFTKRHCYYHRLASGEIHRLVTTIITSQVSSLESICSN